MSSPVSAERHGADESRKLLDALSTVPVQAPVALVAVDSQGIISGGDVRDLKQSIDATCPSPAVSASQEAPAVDCIIDPAAFEVAPTSQMPQDVYKAIRTIRVVLGEAITSKIITPSDGFSPVAELTAVLDVKYGSNMSLDLVLWLLSQFGAQYVDLTMLNGLWVVKDKAPLIVPGWYTFKQHSLLSVAVPTESAATPPFHPAQGERRVVNRGEVGRAYVMRMAFKYVVSSNALDFVCNDWVDFDAFICILGGLEGVVTQPVYGYIDAIQDPHLLVQKINGILCIRDKNPTGLPIVNEGWFQYADDQISRITPAQVQ